MTTDPLTFQDAVWRLERYWAEQGCLVWMPYNVEVGAGTMNPATFLHVLGPEPWNVAYLEPGIRPDDARYGENPNRMGRHHQFQVILKPDPGDAQALYLHSLAVLGIDLARHDVRFVEDDWESPALGAWGLGWEVWLDGLEITQFTYFQQAGSLDLDPVAVEITYGLDRILMALQDVAHFKDVHWNAQVTFADMLLTNEVQTSRYYFEQASVERLTALYDLFEAEADAALRAGLIRPAHDYVLKCSHTFNILDARGAVGVTERARFFARMRRLARLVAEGYVAERAEAGFPLLRPGEPWIAGRDGLHPTPRDDGRDGGRDESPDEPGELPTAPADFVLEVGTEELPAGDLDAALAALAERVPDLLRALRLDYGEVAVLGTPRRLAVMVKALAARQADAELEIVGPPASAAFDAAGEPTRAGLGFARSAGVSATELEIVERSGEARVKAVKREAGRPAAEILAEALPRLLADLPAARVMRWNDSGQAFARPVRWLLALHGGAVVPAGFAGLTAGRTTRGLRPLGSPVLRLAAAGDYRKLMRTHGILVDPADRAADIRRQITALAEAVGGVVPEDPALLQEVANLVEQPHAVRGDFDPAVLELPAAVLVTVMKKHQRTFPILDRLGALQPHFITVANGAGLDADRVRHGNEAVIRARFADAAYFWRHDTARPLADFTPALAGLTFQADLGSMLDKTRRLERLVPALGRRLGLSREELDTARRVAALAKSDLATAMVVDFTALQGIMGREYARHCGEPEAVAQAIYEHVLPRGAGDELPVSGPGIVLALADRLDSLVGLFAAGVRPKGTNDPYALRRAALGVTSILVGRDLSLDLGALIAEVATVEPRPVSAEVKADVLDFLRRRLEVQLREAGQAADAVAAVLAIRGHDPAAATRSVALLAAHVARPDWTATLTAYARCARILRGQTEVPGHVDLDLLVEPAERVLFEAVDAATEDLDPSDLNAVLHTLAALAPAINTFFDEVLVMAEDRSLRANRLALVNRIARLPSYVADLSHMEGF